MKALKLSAAALVCAAALQGPAFAQAPAAGAPPEFLQVITVKVKPAAIADYEDYVKKVVAAAVKIGAPPRIILYQGIQGVPLGTYLAATPFAKWDDMDTFPSIAAMLTKAYGDIEGAKILKAGRAAIDSAEWNIYRTRLDLSSNPKSFDPPMAYVAVTRTELKPEMASDYELILSKIKKAEEGTANGPTVVRRVMLDGPGFVTIASRYFNKWSERGGPGQPDMMRKALGDEEWRQMTDTIGRSIAKREAWILAYRADLSKLTTGGAPTSSQ